MNQEPKLAAPGAGLPWWQLLLLRYFVFPRYSKKMTWESSQAFFEREGQKILRIARTLKPEDLIKRVLVKPMVGIEDSSRYWSVAMVMEHLTIVGDQIADGVVQISKGRRPEKKADVAAVKPGGDIPADKAVERYQGFMGLFLKKTSDPAINRSSSEKFLHPWFGPLDARQWMALSAVHQQIHRKQAEAIQAGLLATYASDISETVPS